MILLSIRRYSRFKPRTWLKLVWEVVGDSKSCWSENLPTGSILAKAAQSAEAVQNVVAVNYFRIVGSMTMWAQGNGLLVDGLQDRWGEGAGLDFYNLSRTGAETNQKRSDGLHRNKSLRSRELIRSVLVSRRCAGSHAIVRDF